MNRFITSTNTTLLVMTWLSAIASSHSSTRRPTTTPTRRLQGNANAKDGESFDLGAWVGDVWDSTKDAVGFDNDDGDDTRDEALDVVGLDGNIANGNVQWRDTGAWDEWLAILLDSNLNGSLNADDNVDLDVCTIVEAAIGMGADFGRRPAARTTGTLTPVLK
jgi:hypothetical protein